MRIFDSILFFVAGGIAGAFACAWWMKQPERERMPPEQQHILLERIKLVSKLITVQGDVVVNSSYYDEYGWGFFAKTLNLTVQGKISVGYDLKKATFEADSVKRIIRIKNLPQPEVLAIDHNIHYQHIEDDLFFRFTPAEMNGIIEVAKSRIGSKNIIDSLSQEAENQGIETLEIIKVLVEQGGWTLEVMRESPKIRDEKFNIDPNKLPNPPQDTTTKPRY